jgi:hypothetical protein
VSPRLPSVLLIVALLGTVSAAAIEVVWPTSMDRASIRLPEDYLQATISENPFSGSFGMVREEGQRFHEGIDIRPTARNAAGEPLDLVFSAMDGQVAYVNNATNGPYGKYVVLTHPKAELLVYTLYAHLAKIDPAVKVGEAMTRGKVIGLMGRTSAGAAAITPDRAHLHFEVGLILSTSFGTWYSVQPENRKSPNLHGLWNGQNLMGMDPMPVLIRTRANLLDAVRSQTAVVSVTMRTATAPDFVKRYPMLVSGDSEHAAGWRVDFSWQGMPIRWTALEAGHALLPSSRWQLYAIDNSVRKLLTSRKMITPDAKRAGELLTQNVEILLAGVR